MKSTLYMLQNIETIWRTLANKVMLLKFHPCQPSLRRAHHFRSITYRPLTLINKWTNWWVHCKYTNSGFLHNCINCVHNCKDHLHLISFLQFLYTIYFIYFCHLFHGNIIWTHNWLAPNISAFIAKLVRFEHCTGSNPVEVLSKLYGVPWWWGRKRKESL